jgi:hypothetical protein
MVLLGKVRYLLEQGKIRRHCSHAKPVLTEKNIANRLQHCLLHIDPTTPKFDAIENVVHIDEKWLNQVQLGGATSCCTMNLTQSDVFIASGLFQIPCFSVRSQRQGNLSFLIPNINQQPWDLNVRHDSRSNIF